MDVPTPGASGIEEIENCWITLADGCRLAARIWLPEKAGREPVSALLEYLPYRKRDHTVIRDEPMHRALAARGFACVRVDMRGNGDSDGLMHDEYLPQELNDAVEVIDWIAGQDWCNGRVGMMGISWGGFNALQVAALRPVPLKAIVTVCSTDDRYADDIHYKGGCLLNDNLAWGATMLAFCTRPPDPTLVGARWREMWQDRIENLPFFAANWLEHQHRDAFWRHGSVCEEPGAIQAAILAAGGWADPYSNAIPRILAGQQAPRRGIVGPWGHKYPQAGEPEPTLDFIEEMTRWWRHWLDDEAEVLSVDEPAYLAWMTESPESPDPARGVTGRWVVEPDWPSANVHTRLLYTRVDGGLAEDRPQEEGAHRHASPQTVGMAAGRFCPKLALGGDMPVDQRHDDAASLVFDSAPLGERVEIFGAPVVELDISVDQPVAHVTARLCDVGEDGASRRVTFGCLNLTHRDSHETPELLEPGKRYRIRLQLDDVAWSFKPGRVLRLALSTSYWPMVWPAPRPVTMTLHSPGTILELPERRPRAEDETVSIAPARSEGEAEISFHGEGATIRRVEQDLTTGESVVTVADDDGGKYFHRHGLSTQLRSCETYRIRPDDPLSARADTEWSCRLWREDWSVEIVTRTSMHADVEAFHLEADIAAFEGGEEVNRRRLSRKIPRQQV